MKHTPEPWKSRETIVYFPDVAGGFDLRHCPDGQANAARIVACVNACRGVPTDALEKAAECFEHNVMGTLAAEYKLHIEILRHALSQLIDAKKREVFTVEVDGDTEEALMNAWTEMHSYWCAAETALIKTRTLQENELLKHKLPGGMPRMDRTKDNPGRAL